jgi:post-segregation antitoxin (ccd killing protein)
MAQKVTITIPDDLAKRLDAVTERFNVSRVCQEALANEVERRELIAKGNETMEYIVKRLKAEKAQCDKEYFDSGRKDGVTDAKKMSYSDLREVVNTFSDLRATDQTAEIMYQTSIWDNWLYDQVTEIANDDGAFSREMYLQGWVDGVLTFWREVKNQL